MSISEPNRTSDFDFWIAEEFAERGEFTALVLLVAIADAKVTPLRSTFLNVIGDEVDWGAMTLLFAGAGATWDGAAFFPVSAPDGGPLDNAAARLRLHDLEHRVDANRLVLNEGHFFDRWGRRLRVDEVELQ